MSFEDRNKWNQRYREDSYRKTNPMTFLEKWLPKVPTGRALDVACGAGRHAILMANAGFHVDAIDISIEGLNLAEERAQLESLDINWIEHDLDQPYKFEQNYNLIVVLWYVNLPLITRLCSCLAPGGYLICEEHLVSKAEVIGPENPNFRVAEGALKKAVTGLSIEHYQEAVQSNRSGDHIASAQIVARRK